MTRHELTILERAQSALDVGLYSICKAHLQGLAVAAKREHAEEDQWYDLEAVSRD